MHLSRGRRYTLLDHDLHGQRGPRAPPWTLLLPAAQLLNLPQVTAPLLTKHLVQDGHPVLRHRDDRLPVRLRLCRTETTETPVGERDSPFHHVPIRTQKRLMRLD